MSRLVVVLRNNVHGKIGRRNGESPTSKFYVFFLFFSKRSTNTFFSASKLSYLQKELYRGPRERSDCIFILVLCEGIRVKSVLVVFFFHAEKINEKTS